MKWRHEFSKQYPKTWPAYGTAMSPIVDRGLVIAHVGGQDKGALIAFDAETGAVKWRKEIQARTKQAGEGRIGPRLNGVSEGVRGPVSIESKR